MQEIKHIDVNMGNAKYALASCGVGAEAWPSLVFPAISTAEFMSVAENLVVEIVQPAHWGIVGTILQLLNATSA